MRLHILMANLSNKKRLAPLQAGEELLKTEYIGFLPEHKIGFGLAIVSQPLRCKICLLSATIKPLYFEVIMI